MILELAIRVATESGTPVAVVDEVVMEANLRRMAEFAAASGVRLRPHAKTHKSVEVARWQLALGATGLTVATLTEAETFAAAGVDDLLIAHPPVGEVKLRRLGALAARLGRLAVAVDDVGVASMLPAHVEVMWEVDTGQHRIGTPAGDPTFMAVADLVRAIGQSRFRGLITHGGHAYQAKDDAERRMVAAQEANGLLETAGLLRSRGIEVRELSIGSTPTMGAHPLEGITEIRPGTYVYADANQVTLGVMRLEDCALAVAACVVSTPAEDRAVIDAGSKALSADLRVPGMTGFGIVLGKPHLNVARLSEEHAVLTSAGATGLSVGDFVVIVPTHVCTVVNLHPEMAIVDRGGVARWQAIDARGWR
ncbi:MAG TPA: alanine racemase [Candidatus Dormibacteraeota bacterium]|nr:alanine racemase [Candidatus Dormibacteraeota bacterium]